MNKNTNAFDEVFSKIREDEGLYIAWQSNIAVQFQDEVRRKGYDFPDLHELSNNAAKNFLNLLIVKAEPLKEIS